MCSDGWDCPTFQPTRESGSLSGGESQRCVFANQLQQDCRMYFTCLMSLRSVCIPGYTKVAEILEELRDKGNSVLVVEHEEEFIVMPNGLTISALQQEYMEVRCWLTCRF